MGQKMEGMNGWEDRERKRERKGERKRERKGARKGKKEREKEREREEEEEEEEEEREREVERERCISDQRKIASDIMKGPQLSLNLDGDLLHDQLPPEDKQHAARGVSFVDGTGGTMSAGDMPSMSISAPRIHPLFVALGRKMRRRLTFRRPF